MFRRRLDGFFSQENGLSFGLLKGGFRGVVLKVVSWSFVIFLQYFFKDEWPQDAWLSGLNIPFLLGLDPAIHLDENSWKQTFHADIPLKCCCDVQCFI